MPCPWRTFHPQLLLTVTFLLTECLSVGMEGISMSSTSLAPDATEKTSKKSDNSGSTSSSVDKEKSTTKQTEVHSHKIVTVGTKVVLSCPSIHLSCLMLATWEIPFEGKINCILAYSGEGNNANNCSDKGVTWASSPDQNPALQIDPVAISHEGNYTCQIVTPDGNFHSTYQLEVLVPPEVITGNRSRTAMCSAAAGKPAAQISWAPQGACVSTEQKEWDNDTLTTVQSICHMAENVSTVNCSVFHLTGNKTISIGDFAREDSSRLLYFCLSSIFIIILIIIWFLKSNCCRKCKWKEREDSLVVEEGTTGMFVLSLLLICFVKLCLSMFFLVMLEFMYF